MSLEELIRAAEVDSEVRLLVVFGSRARDAGSPKSDLDLGVSVAHEAARARVEVALSRAAKLEADIVDLDSAAPQLRFEIAREGRLLFERAPHLWADFRARAMIDWWDWAPVLRQIQTAAIDRLRAGTHGSA